MYMLVLQGRHHMRSCHHMRKTYAKHKQSYQLFGLSVFLTWS